MATGTCFPVLVPTCSTSPVWDAAQERYDEGAFALMTTKDTAVVRQYYENLLEEGNSGINLIDCKVSPVRTQTWPF